MGFRFFKRIQLAPGISINLSRSGVSASLGPRGAKVTLGPRGIRKTVGLPGTGMYYTTYSSWKSKKKTPPPSPEEASAAEEESAAEEPQLALGFFDRLVTPENEENFIDGLRAFLEGELEKALDFFSRSPECPDGAFVGGIIALRLERFAEAADLLCRALDDVDKFGSLFDRYEIELDIALPEKGDDILPFFAAGGYLGYPVLVLFTIGIIAAAFSSADSALAALTTSFCIDLLDIGRYPEEKAQKIRRYSHLFISAVFIGCILTIEAIGSRNVIDTIYVLASYTYGPLLGLFAFGLFTRFRVRDRFVPYVAIFSPLVCWQTDYLVSSATGYQFGYEMLMVNGLLTFCGLLALSYRNSPEKAMPDIQENNRLF